MSKHLVNGLFNTCFCFRGAVATIKDGGGRGALERAMDMGSITDDELLILLSEGK